MSRYTDWTGGEPIEKEWTMTTDPALRALVARAMAVLEPAEDGPAADAYDILSEALAAAAEAAPLDAALAAAGITADEAIEAVRSQRAEAAPPSGLDVERLARALDLAERTGGNYRNMKRSRWLAEVTATKYAALAATSREASDE